MSVKICKYCNGSGRKQKWSQAELFRSRISRSPLPIEPCPKCNGKGFRAK